MSEVVLDPFSRWSKNMLDTEGVTFKTLQEGYVWIRKVSNIADRLLVLQRGIDGAVEEIRCYLALLLVHFYVRIVILEIMVNFTMKNCTPGIILISN
jgi:hypothetical protein